MKKFSVKSKASSAIRPHAPGGIGFHAGRAVHGSNPPVKTLETKTAPKAHKPSAPHAKKIKA